MSKKKKSKKVVADESGKELTPYERRKIKKAEADRLEKVNAQRLAQIVNLHIGGFSLADIGASIGATPAEVDRMLNQDMSRYVRNQPALRVFVRNYVSERYSKLLESVWEDAVDKDSKGQLEKQDRAIRILDSMRRLHGADAPVQTEVKVEAAPESVEKLVQALASGQGYGYDASIFDVEVISDSAEAALADASDRVEDAQDDDEEWES